jgi:hypothetical protein
MDPFADFSVPKEGGSGDVGGGGGNIFLQKDNERRWSLGEAGNVHAQDRPSVAAANAQDQMRARLEALELERQRRSPAKSPGCMPVAIGQRSRTASTSSMASTNASDDDDVKPAVGAVISFDPEASAVALDNRGAGGAMMTQNRMFLQLFMMATNGNLDGACQIIELLRETNSVRKGVRAKQQGGYTPLHGAARQGNADIIRVLIDQGADCSARTDFGKTALELAIKNGKQEVVAILEPLSPQAKAMPTSPSLPLARPRTASGGQSDAPEPSLGFVLGQVKQWRPAKRRLSLGKKPYKWKTVWLLLDDCKLEVFKEVIKVSMDNGEDGYEFHNSRGVLNLSDLASIDAQLTTVDGQRADCGFGFKSPALPGGTWQFNAISSQWGSTGPEAREKWINVIRNRVEMLSRRKSKVPKFPFEFYAGRSVMLHNSEMGHVTE